MPTTEVTINNKPLSTMGVAMLSGAYAALLTPPSLKEFVENDDPTQNGIDIIVPDSPVVNERDVTLTFLLKGTSQEAFLSNYAAFVAELHKGTVTLYVPDLGNTYSGSGYFGNGSGTYKAEGDMIYTYIDGEELYRYKVHSISNGIAEVSMGVAGDNITLEIKLQKK